MQPKVKKCSATTLPRSSARLSGAELIQSSTPRTSGARANAAAHAEVVRVARQLLELPLLPVGKQGNYLLPLGGQGLFGLPAPVCLGLPGRLLLESLRLLSGLFKDLGNLPHLIWREAEPLDHLGRQQGIEPPGLHHKLPKPSLLIPLQNLPELQIDLVDQLPSFLGILDAEKLDVPQTQERFVYLADRLLQRLDLLSAEAEFFTDDRGPNNSKSGSDMASRLGDSAVAGASRFPFCNSSAARLPAEKSSEPANARPTKRRHRHMARRSPWQLRDVYGLISALGSLHQPGPLCERKSLFDATD